MVVAINAAGESGPSAAVKVMPRAKGSILITGARTGKRDAVVTVRGEVDGLNVSSV